MGFAAVLKENLINVAVRDALAIGPQEEVARWLGGSSGLIDS